MADYVLLVDIGNTTTVTGLYRGSRVSRVEKFSTPTATLARISKHLSPVQRTTSIEAAIVSSVVPKQNSAWKAAIRKRFDLRPLMVDHRCSLGIPIDYPKPETIGADRLANASGAAVRYGTPVIVADFGTALTFDVVSKKRGYIGGVIAPGIPLMFDYFADRTALLPKIEMGRVGKGIGKNSGEAMRLGVRWGYRGMVKEILKEILKLPGQRGSTVCATGGYAREILKDIDFPIEFEHNLTLYGLGTIWELNK